MQVSGTIWKTTNASIFPVDGEKAGSARLEDIFDD
jgi:hypothetical protein